MRTCCWKDDFGVDYSIKDAGFELLIEVGVKGLDDVYTLKKIISQSFSICATYFPKNESRLGLRQDPKKLFDESIVSDVTTLKVHIERARQHRLLHSF